MKRFYRILSVILCLAMFVPALATAAFAAAPVNTKASTETPDAPEELATLSSYLHASVSTEDNTSHLPVNVHTYYYENKTYTPNDIGVDGTVSILYVMNTNTERLGTKSDAALVQSFLDRGYFVIVLDYMNNPEACGTALDWSTQDIRCQVIGGSPFTGGRAYTPGTYTDGKLAGENSICSKSYIVPAGYDIAYNIPYFSYDKHGTAGTFELIVEIWNNDFKSVKRNTIVKWVDENGMPKLDHTEAITEKAQTDTSNVNYATWFKTADGKNPISQSDLEGLSQEEQKQYQYTYIGNTKVDEITDCVKPDGSLVDLSLYCDIIYPAGYSGELPTMITMASSYTRANSWTSETRPYLNGPLFNGYVGVVSDYGLVPMCRNDHYGYFCGDSQLNSISGDNGTYSLSYYNGIHSDTALLRMLRLIGAEGMDVEGYGHVCAPINPEKIGAYGNSKGGVIVRLANPTPEKLQELRCFENHNGETRLEAFEEEYPYVDPYLDASGNSTNSLIAAPEAQPFLTYSNGETVHSGLNFVFANCGGAANTLVEGSAPIFGVGTQSGKAEGSYYTYYRETANLARNLNIPFFGLVAPTIAHDLGYGLDKDYGLDILESFNTYADYWLKDESPECIIIDVDTTQDICAAADVPLDNVYEINEHSSIKLQFTGSIPAYEIEKVEIVNVATGEKLRGEWYGSYGDQQWKFVPYDIEDASYYTIIVPDDICALNGQYLKETVTHTFRTTNGITEDALSVTLPKTNIASYDCVNRGFSVAASGYTLDQSTYKFNAFKGTGYGLQIDLRAINDSNGINNNQNVRFPIFDEIWADAKYIGQTITFTFEAKASEAGSIKLSLTQHGNGNYVWGDGWQLISAQTDLTTEWQTFTYQFVVTEELFAARANSTSSTPDIALGVRFSGFVKDGKYTDAVLNFRNFTTSYTPKADNPSLNNENDVLFFNFAQKDYSTAHNITLLFAVANDAINTVGVYKVSGGTIGEKLGEVTVVGTGIYNFDVTDYVKSCNGAPSVAVKLEKAVGTTTLKDFDVEGGTTGIGMNALAKYVITDEISNADGSSNNSIEVEHGIRSAYYIDLNGDLVSKHTYSLYQFAASTNGFKAGAFTESDYGKRYRVTFRVYDETTRVINVFNGDGYNFDREIADFNGSNYSFYTTAGEWTTVTIEFTVNDPVHLVEDVRSHIFFFYAENRSVASLDPDAAVNIRNMAAATTKPGNYAGQPGLNDKYTEYASANAAAVAGKVTYYEDLSYSLYIDDVVFEEVTTGVQLAETMPMLSITPTTTSEMLPVVSASVLSTDPDNAQSGLWISGGKDGFDTKSVKSYVKLSLDGYFGGYSAFVFNAQSTATANVSVYAVADVDAGQSWTPATITSATAPANDIYGAGVNLGAVYGNKALATFAVDNTSKSCVVELTEFTEHMLANGAREITLIIVSDAKNVTTIEIPGGEKLTKVGDYDCINNGPATGAGGYTLDQSTYKFWTWLKGEDGGIQIDTRSISGGVNANQNARLSVFKEIWLDRSYIGKTIRFSFRAKASENGSIRLTLNQRQKYAFSNFPGLDETVDLTTEWQTFTFEFVVTEAMYDCITNGDDPNGIEAQGLALGIRFTDFSNGTTYDPAQLVFRDFIVNCVEMPPEANIFRDSYDMSATKPTVDTRGYGKQLATITDGVLEIDLTKDSQAPNANAYTRVTALDKLFADESNKGKTFVITFKAKATQAGQLDFAFNKYGSFNTYEYGGIKCSAQYDLTTEWQTFNFTFVATADMFTTHASTNLNLAFRLYNGFGGATGAYTPAQVYIDDITVTENPYVRSVDYTYDMSTTKPAFDTRGYGKQLATIADGVLQIDLTKDSQAPNANAYTRVEALDQAITTENIGKSFVITFKAKATQAGQLDFAFNKYGSFNTYAYGGRTFKEAYQLTTEYQTFSFTFTVTEDMVTTHATTALNLAFRLYNGFGGSTGAYYPAQVYIDDIRVYEDMTVSAPTLDVTGTVAVSGQGNSNSLNVYADDSATGAPKIQKTYLYYDLSAVTTSYGATLKVNLSGANGETVRVYLISGATLTAPVTYANAPVPTGSPVASFVAKNGLNTVDVSKAIAENVGKNVILVLAIEEPSDQVQVTSTPVLTVSEEYHNYTSESQKHEAKAPTYKAPGNVEFYTCEGCDKLYVKNGADFVEVTIGDVILPILECPGHNFVDDKCTICGKKTAHTCAGGTATCQKRAECSICGKEYGELADHTAEVVSGKAPTCTANGLTDGEKCSVCGTVTVAQTEIPATGHNYSATVTAPTCTEGGYTTYTCSVCNDSYVADQTASTGHTEETISAVAPTCTATGLTEGKQCTVCGELTLAQAVVDALGHTEATVPGKAPTCTDTGLTEGKQCSVCGTTTVEQSTVPANGHSYNAVVTDPTCTAGGYTTNTCSVCGDTYTSNQTAAKGHTWSNCECTACGTSLPVLEKTDSFAFTTQSEFDAVVTGGKLGFVGSFRDNGGTFQFNTNSSIQFVVPANTTVTVTGHSAQYGVFNIFLNGEKADLVASNGVYTFTVREETKVVIATGDNGASYSYIKSISLAEYVDRTIVADTTITFGSAGNYKDSIVDFSGIQIGDNGGSNSQIKNGSFELILKAGSKVVIHGYPGYTSYQLNGSAEITDEFFTFITTEDTVLTVTPVNGNNYFYSIEITLHEGVTLVSAKAPTCTEAGYGEHYVCSCHAEPLTDKGVVNALGHTEESISAVAPTCTATGLTEGKKCSVCGVTTVEQSTVPANGHSYDAVVTAPTCTAGGYTTYTCSVCNDSYVADETAATGHTEQTLPAVAPGCTMSGITEGKKCTVCGTVTVEQTNIPATGHTEEGIPGKAATCTEAGLTAGLKCSVCGTVTVGHKTIPATGHTEETLAGKTPNCTETGLTEGKKCTVCGTVTVEQTEIPALGHTWKDATEEAPKTCETCGATEGERKTSSIERILLAILNFFRQLFGLSELSIDDIPNIGSEIVPNVDFNKITKPDTAE